MDELVKKYLALHEKPKSKSLSWHLGVDDDLLIETERQNEFISWLDYIDSELY